MNVVLDAAITGGLVVTPTGPAKVDVGVKDGLVAALWMPDGSSAPEAAQTITLHGELVLPGGIDPHVHTNWVVPTAADTGVRAFDPGRVSRAAAYGGTTTLVDFAMWQPGETLKETFEHKEEEWKGLSVVDYAFHGTFRHPEIPFEVLEMVPQVVADGHASFKVWMTNTTPGRPWQKSDLGQIWGLMEATSAAGAMLCVHAEDDDLVMYGYKRLEHAGQTHYSHVHQVHSNLSEEVSFQRVITLAKRTGAAIYLMHVSAAEGVEAIRSARAQGLPVYGETLQHYLYFTADDYTRPDGAIYHTYPSLKSAADRDAMWQALRDGTLSTIATDELCTDFATKVRGQTIHDVTGGHAGVEVRLAIAYTEAVARRNMSLVHFADITSANAARILGMYPTKGAIAVNSDADLVVFDPGRKRVLHAADLHESDYTPWEGYEAAGSAVLTMLRGRILVEDGALSGEEPIGSLVRRRVDPATLSRPTC
jgi:dihydropyrimidinase